MIPLTDTDEDLLVEDDSAETVHQDDCYDCKKKVQVALLDTLPSPVGSGEFINRDNCMAIFILSAGGLIWVSRVDMGYDMKIAIS